MTDIERTLSRLTRAHKQLAKLEALLDECEAALRNNEMIDQCGLRPATLEDVTFLVGSCADQEAKIDQLCLRLAIQKHGHDWDSIKAMAKDIKRHYSRRAQ
jgi:hypothetical protein